MVVVAAFLSVGATECTGPALGYVEEFDTLAVYRHDPPLSADGRHVLVSLSGWVHEPGAKVFVSTQIGRPDGRIPQHPEGISPGFSSATDCGEPTLERPDVSAEIDGISPDARVGFECEVRIPIKYAFDLFPSGDGVSMLTVGVPKVTYLVWVRTASGSVRVLPHLP